MAYIDDLRNEIDILKSELEEKNKKLQELLSMNEEIDKIRSFQEKIAGKIEINEKYFYIDRFKKQDFRIHNTLIDTVQYNSFNYFKNKKECEEFARFEHLNLKLIRLRNKLNNGWQPDWNDRKEYKHFIALDNNEIVEYYYHSYKVSNLYFKTEELRREFLELIPKEEIIEYLKF